MSGPWEQFQQGRTVDSGPWTQFAAPKPMDAMAQSKPKEDFGIDFSKPVPEVRAEIGKLPEPKQKAALDAWADHYVANENRNGTGVENVVRTVARGTPIGSWLDELTAKTVGVANRISGGAIGAPEDEVLAYNRARDRAFDTANPKTSMGLQLGGALASAPFTPTVRAVQGATLAGRGINALVNGAAYGTAYGAGLGEDASGRLEKGIEGGAIGGAIGAAMAPIATGVANATKFVADKYRGIPAPLSGYSRGAVDRVSRAMADDGLYQPNGGPPGPRTYANEAATLGNEGMLADLGPNLLSQAKGIATQRGRGQEIIKDAMEGRARGASGRIAADTDAVLGPAQNLVQLEDAVVSAAKARAKPLYDQFYNTPIKPTDELVSSLQRVPRSAWTKAQQLAEMEGVDLAQVINTGRGVDLIKRAIDDVASDARLSDPNLHRLASTLASDIRNATDRILNPRDPTQSVWAQARREAGEGFQFSEGLDQGRQAFSRGTHPDQLAADLAGMNPVERQAFQAGARGQVRDIMGTASTANGEAGATAARRSLGSDYAREKLQMIAPPQGPLNHLAPPQQLINRLDAETRFASSRSQAYQGTETAARTAAQKEFPNALTRSDAANEVGKKSLSGMAMEGVYRALNAALGGHLDARNAAVATDAARLLAAQGASRDQLAQALMGYGNARAITARGRDAIDRIAQMILDSARPTAINAATGTTMPNR